MMNLIISLVPPVKLSAKKCKISAHILNEPYSSFCLIFSHFVFPASPRFVFIMGTSVALSINSLLRAGLTRCSLLRKVVWRSLQLFIIGVVIINPNYCQGPCECKHT